METEIYKIRPLFAAPKGFIGGNLVKRLKRAGYWVRGVDLKFNEYAETKANDFVIGDLREQYLVRRVTDRRFYEVYQLAAMDQPPSRSGHGQADSHP